MQGVTPDSIRVTLERVVAAPEYQWRERAHPFADLIGWVGRFLDRFRDLETSHPLLYWVTIALMTAVLIAILVHFGYLLWQSLKPRDATGLTLVAAATPRRDATWYAAEAQRLLARGLVREAMAAQFRALVLTLDRRGALSFHPSKTPAEYVHELRLGEPQLVRFRGLVLGLYGYLFAGRPCGPDDFVRVRSEMGEVVSGAAQH